jgi:hypothetical protein
MMTANLHCNHAHRSDVMVQWVRSHAEQPVGTQDYFDVTVSGDGGEVTLFLSPKQLVTLVEKLSSAVVDRGVVLAEEAGKASPVETGGGG